ncbi:alpha/beta hydrolase [Fredinandcohnia onubensis]|uniref:alpha/beta hydrolase n=1 Tax=Fredinandcohnia onubensis TaxID=1571209 RepID=UPI000C0BCA9A|nr:dienelactone hydrolase family protein [Fredinandcohnia onubensis]
MNSPFTYELRHPSTIDPDKKYPALFLMHGMGSNEQDLLSLVRGLEDTFYIYSIRGPLTQPPGYAFFTIEGYGKPHREVFDQSIGQLTNFLDYASQYYPIDQERIYLLGFSQGAIVSMTLGLALGDRIKGIVALSGYIPAFVKEDYDIQPVDNLSIFISHGEHDPVLPFEWGVESKEFFERQGANVSFHSYPEGHTVSLQNYRDLNEWITFNLKNGGNTNGK